MSTLAINLLQVLTVSVNLQEPAEDNLMWPG